MTQFTTTQNQTIESVARILKKCRSIFFITGAGVSADSGVPTYRGIGGMYEVDVTEEGLPIEEILSGPMFKKNPELTWKYLGQIAEAARGAQPNRAHQVIAEMEQQYQRVWTLTQNVDGFHLLSGSRNVIEIHGNMRRLSCTSCSYQQEINEDTLLEVPPYCPVCNKILRPDVVLFEEMLPERALNQLYEQAQKGFDAVFSIGTSSVFPYIQQPVHLAKQLGVPTIEINPCQTALSYEVDYHLDLGAAEALDAIWQKVR